jgi:hypothetical protein
MEGHVHDRSSSTRNPYRLPLWLACIAFLGIGSFYLLTEHRAHTLGALPYVLLLLCPALHLLMHGRHGQHGHGEHREPEDRPGGRP